MDLAGRLLAARSLARAGRHDEAIGVLRRTAERHPHESDVWLRLGEQLAIDGDVNAAGEALRRSAKPREVGRRPLDAVTGMGLLAALHGDGPMFESAIVTWRASETVPNRESLPDELRAVWSFCRGEFLASSLDPRPALILLPLGEVLRAWAALERGADPARVTSGADAWLDDPETREPARLLVAAARLRLGEPEPARELAAKALAVLEPHARTSLEARLLLPLAHRVLADALAAAGDSTAARGHVARAAALAPRCWFGRRGS
jgi:Flp pilus assembly protein TadD